MKELFLGSWQLDPTRSQYEFGEPPAIGTYIIERDGEDYVFSMAWTTQAGASHEMAFRGTPDGEAHPFENPAVADTLTLTLVDEHTLDSAVSKGGQQIAYARRVLSEDKQEMTVTQSGKTPDGTAFDNVSVYVRQL